MKTPRLHLVPTISPEVLVYVVHAIVGNVLLVCDNALVPRDEAVRPASPAPSAILVSRALELTMLWVLLVTLGAGLRVPLRPIQQGDPLQEAHLVGLRCCTYHFLLYVHLDWWCKAERAGPLGVGAVLAQGALTSAPVLSLCLLATFTCLVPLSACTGSSASCCWFLRQRGPASLQVLRGAVRGVGGLVRCGVVLGVGRCSASALG